MKNKTLNSVVAFAVITTSVFAFSVLSQASSTQKLLTKVQDIEKPENISEELFEEIDVQSEEEVEVIAKYKIKPGKPEMDIVEIEHNGKIKYKYEKVDYLAFSVPQSELELLAEEDPNIEYIELDYEIVPTLSASREHIQVDSAFEEYGFTGEGIKVEVIDTGIDNTHYALTHAIVEEKDYTGQGTQDVIGHGTHVSCIIACEDEVYYGVAPKVDLYVAKVIKSSGSGNISDVIAAIEWGIEKEVDVINISLGATVPQCGDDLLSQAVNSAVEQGPIIVTSAGNGGPTASTITTPGCAEKAVTVGATNADITVRNNSSRGPTYDGRVKPDIVAPGLRIMSALPGDRFGRKSGTSMASPHIAGLSALLLEADSKQDPEEVKDLIMSTALDFGLDENTQGAGLAQALSAMDELNIKDKPSFGKEFGKCISEHAKNQDFEGFEECKEIFKEELEKFLEDKKKDKDK